MRREKARCFFIEKKVLAGAVVALSEREAHHLVHVLRLGKGSKVKLSDGRGGLWRGEVAGVTPEVKVKVLEAELTSLQKLQISLAFPMIKNRKKMDWLIEKIQELGVSEFYPYRCDRTQGQGESASDQRRLSDRWGRIAREAMKQSESRTLLVTHSLSSFDQLLAIQNEFDLLCIPHPQESSITMREWLIRNQKIVEERKGGFKVLVVIGPEGGFSRREAQSLCDRGLARVGLGSSILKSETAAITTVAFIQLFWGSNSEKGGF